MKTLYFIHRQGIKDKTFYQYSNNVQASIKIQYTLARLDIIWYFYNALAFAALDSSQCLTVKGACTRMQKVGMQRVR